MNWLISISLMILGIYGVIHPKILLMSKNKKKDSFLTTEVFKKQIKKTKICSSILFFCGLILLIVDVFFIIIKK